MIGGGPQVSVLLRVLVLAAAIFTAVTCTTVPYRDAAKATVLMEAGRYQEALVEYTRAINLKPDYSTAYLGRGYVYQRLGDYWNALADYTTVIQLAPEDPEVYVRRGLLYDLMDRPGMAIADYSRAILLDPSHANAFHYRGMARERLKDPQAAAADFEVAASMGQTESREKLLAMNLEKLGA